MKRMNWFSFLIYHCILTDIALALAIAGNQIESKEPHVNGSVADKTTLTTLAPETTTTEMPRKDVANEEKPKKPELKPRGRTEEPEAELKTKEVLEKPLPKKRGVLQDLYYKHPLPIENGFDLNDVPVQEDIFAGSRPDAEERSFFRSNGYGDSGFLNDDGYFENDGRSKRTAILDGIYNGPQDYSKPEFELTPDEVISLLSLLEERRLYNNAMQNRWPGYDNTIDSIEADMRDEDMYKDRDGDHFGEIYDGNRENLGRYPTGMKRYMISKRRSDLLGNPKLRIPIFRRSVL